MPPPIKILVIEDDEDDVAILQMFCSKITAFACEIYWIHQFDEALEAITSGNYKVIFVDYNLGSYSGLELIETALQAKVEAPIIMLTDHDSQDLYERVTHLGISDYIPKSDITPPLLARSILHSLNRKPIEIKLRESEERYRTLSESSSEILHDIGNILNSIAASCSQIDALNKRSKLKDVTKIGNLIHQHKDIPSFLSEHPKGKLIPKFLVQLSQTLDEEQQTVKEEFNNIRRGFNLVKGLVYEQQDQAKDVMSWEVLALNELAEESLSIQMGYLLQHRIGIETNYTAQLEVKGQRLKIIHVLINLIKNAVHAMQNIEGERKLSIKTGTTEENAQTYGYLRIKDTGTGIKKDNLNIIFAPGFTTKEYGHGFGLRHCRKVMTELNGFIRASSEGDGACFDILLPLQPRANMG